MGVVKWSGPIALRKRFASPLPVSDVLILFPFFGRLSFPLRDVAVYMFQCSQKGRYISIEQCCDHQFPFRFSFIDWKVR